MTPAEIASAVIQEMGWEVGHPSNARLTAIIADAIYKDREDAARSAARMRHALEVLTGKSGEGMMFSDRLAIARDALAQHQGGESDVAPYRVSGLYGVTDMMRGQSDDELNRLAQEWDRNAASGPVTFKPNPYLEALRRKHL